MGRRCVICGLPIEDMDRFFGRVTQYKSAEAHSYCRVLTTGAIPECPLSESLQPSPECTSCCQAMDCSKLPRCDCQNLKCQIGHSVRVLREQGKIP